MSVAPANLTDPRIIALIEYHQRELLASSPPGHAFVLDLSGLRAPEITVLADWDGDDCIAVGALKRIGNRHSELKSMRTHPDHLRKGVARRLLDALLALARSEGMRRISLETGSGEKFEPALALYRQNGFVNGPAFADYRLTDFNQCLHLDL